MSNINWTIIIFAGLVLVGTWLFVPSPFHKYPEVVHTSPSGTGNIELVHTDIPVPADSGIYIGVKQKVKPKSRPIMDSVPNPSVIPYKIPLSVSGEVDTTMKDGTIVNIRATTFMELESDSLATYTDIEWRIQPKPMVVDTIYVSVPVMEEVPFFEKPIPVIISTVLIVIVVNAILQNITKK